MLLERLISCRVMPAPSGGILQTQLQTGARLFPSRKRIAFPCRAEARREKQPETGAANGSWSKHMRRLAASSLTAVGTAAAIMPGAAVAAELSGVRWPDMYWASVGVGVSCATLTVWATSRFLLSFFPELEKKGHCLPWRLLTAPDPVLLPLQRGLFQMEPGDLHYGAVVLLGFTVSLLESLVGDGGLWLEKVPDLDLLAHLQYLVFCGHCLLLPTWVLVLFRFFAVL